MITQAKSAAERYDRALRYARHTDLLPEQPLPQPTSTWPDENIDPPPRKWTEKLNLLP